MNVYLYLFVTLNIYIYIYMYIYVHVSVAILAQAEGACNKAVPGGSQQSPQPQWVASSADRVRASP